MSCTDCIIIENKRFTLTIGPDCAARSLVLRDTGEECLLPGENVSLFALTEDRPFNNEIKLAHPNKRTTYQANRIRRDGDRYVVGFELIGYEAVIEIAVKDDYAAFTLVDYIIHEEDFAYLAMTPPPVTEFRLVQLPVRQRARFGEWLNVMADDTAAVAVIGAHPFVRVDAHRRKEHRLMCADVMRDFRIKGCPAVLIAAAPDALLDCIDAMEKDYDLPRGVESRRAPTINSSIYWTGEATPATIDRHIATARQAGLKMMTLYYTAFFRTGRGYDTCGNYDECDLRPEFANGFADVKAMVDKIRAAGITPGLHFLQTHIGMASRYVTPVADYRLNLTRRFALSRPLGETDDVVYVEQDPYGCVMDERCRVLKFGGELITYEGFTTERPYCFTGCRRGAYNTTVTAHPTGEMGGILDISEFGATSCYLDQTSGLQDEIAEKLARVFDCGFEYVYFDGSEGTNPPFDIYVPYAQYRVWKAFRNKTILCEGAAKAHFSWHFLSGGNAFDVFPMNIFKQKIVEHPLEEADRMACDFTRLNFGWWMFADDTMPDHYEFGTSKAAAWDCPITMMANPEVMAANPRTADTFEVLRRWEDVRARKWLTPEQKIALRDPETEYTLLVNESGEYELTAVRRLETAADVTAYAFERDGRAWVVCWHRKGEGRLSLPLSAALLTYETELGGGTTGLTADGDRTLLHVDGKRYLSAAVAPDVLAEAFRQAAISE